MKNFQVGKLTLDPRDLAILKCPQSDLPLTVLVDREGRIAISHAGIDPLSLSQKVFFGDCEKPRSRLSRIARHKALADLRAFGITLHVRARTRGRKCYQGAVCKLVDTKIKERTRIAGGCLVPSEFPDVSRPMPRG
jgi:hypothetical protein